MERKSSHLPTARRNCQELLKRILHKKETHLSILHACFSIAFFASMSCGQTEASRCRSGSDRSPTFHAYEPFAGDFSGAAGRFNICLLVLEDLRQARPRTPDDQIIAVAATCNIIYEEHVDCGKRSRRWNSSNWPLPGDKN